MGKVGGAAGEVSPRIASSTPPPPPPPCATDPKGGGQAVAVDLDNEEAAVRAFDAALVSVVRLFVGGTDTAYTIVAQDQWYCL